MGVVIDYQMDVYLIDLFDMHVWDNPKLEKYSRYTEQKKKRTFFCWP